MWLSDGIPLRNSLDRSQSPFFLSEGDPETDPSSAITYSVVSRMVNWRQFDTYNERARLFQDLGHLDPAVSSLPG